MKYIVALLALLAGGSAFAQKLDVKIVNRQEHNSTYTYVVAGYSTSRTAEGVNCNGTTTDLNCNGTSTTNTVSMPAQAGSFSVRGATFSLLLPDGRTAVVNCDIKFAEHFAGAAGNHRNCRQPLNDNVQAEFKGSNAKLEWVVSIDGKKKESETYELLGVLGNKKE
jgi:hypothetical protein